MLIFIKLILQRRGETMKKILFTTIFLILLAACLQAFTLGDVNGDNGVTIIDALMTAQYAVGLNPVPFNAEAADMNWDGRADIIDALQLAQFYVSAMHDFTIFVMSQCNPSEEDPQVYALKPDLNFRAIMKWDLMGDEAGDYNFTAVQRYHDNNITFIGGGTATIIFEHDFPSHEIFMDMATRDASNQLVRHDEVLTGTEGLYRGSIANPQYRKYVTDWAKLQIDGGVDGLCFDEVIAGFSGGSINNYNGNEGFDDYCIADFNKYLMEKYPAYTAQDWKNKYSMTDANIIRKNISPDDLVNNFNYRKYLQDHGWNGTTTETGPLNPANPLAEEWGSATNNRMYKTDTFLGIYTARYWQEIVYALRAYAKEKYHKNIYITSNGILPFVDFNCLGMYPWNPDEQTPDYRGADYVPVADGHLNGTKSLMSVYKMLYNRNHETAGNVPLVVFIDWPTEMLDNYNNLPLEEKKDYWQIFGAEAYACGLYPAFHLKDTLGTLTASGAGTLDFFKIYKRFYKTDKEIFSHQDYFYSDTQVSVNRSGIARNLMINKDGNRYALHLINHNYNNGIILQQNFTVTLSLNHTPRSVSMISPDFDGEKVLTYTNANNQLSINVDEITYYDVILIE